MSGDDLRESKIDGEKLYDGAVLRLERDRVRLSDGAESFREVIRHRGAVCVIPLTDDGQVIFVEQYRYAVDRVMLEIPAGKLDRADEPREAAARRELEEETGYDCHELRPLGLYLGSPAILDEKISMYVALGLIPGKAHTDPDEFLRVRTMPLSEAVDLILAGEVPDGKTQAAVLRVAAMRARGEL